MDDQRSGTLSAAADSSFLIGLAFAEQVHLLDSMFERVFVPPAVWQEVVLRGAGRPGAAILDSVRVLEQRSADNLQAVALLEVFLGPGESETLVLAQESGCDLVLLDDLRARKAAQNAGLRTIGVVGFLLAAKRQGYVEELGPLLDRLISQGFRLGDTLIRTALREAGE